MKTLHSEQTQTPRVHLEYRIGDKERYLQRRCWEIRERTRQMPRPMLAATVDSQRWPPIVFWNGVLRRRHPRPVCIYTRMPACRYAPWLVR